MGSASGSISRRFWCSLVNLNAVAIISRKISVSLVFIRVHSWLKKSLTALLA
jgi:hypothetical protein